MKLVTLVRLVAVWQGGLRDAGGVAFGSAGVAVGGVLGGVTCLPPSVRKASFSVV